MLVYEQLKEGTHPRLILEMLRADPDIQRRQFGIVDIQGRSVGFSGRDNRAASLSRQGRVAGTDIHYSVQGNILASDAVVRNAASAFESADGDLLDRVMAAMEAADEAGGDARCTCETPPVPDAPCDGRNAHVAYILAADPDDREGESFNDGSYALFIDVTDENIRPTENANPVSPSGCATMPGSSGTAIGTPCRDERSLPFHFTQDRTHAVSRDRPAGRTPSRPRGVQRRARNTGGSAGSDRSFDRRDPGRSDDPHRRPLGPRLHGGRLPPGPAAGSGRLFVRAAPFRRRRAVHDG